MSDSRRRFVSYLALIVGLAVAYALVYSWGMATFEGRPRTFAESLAIVVETFTTTGYGDDAVFWTSVQMEILMIAMQLTGVVTLFAALPLFVAPWIEHRLSATVPTSTDLSGHVVLCEFTARGEALIDELEPFERDYVVVEPDRERAETLHSRGLSVIHGDPESVGALSGACVADAEAVVVDTSDDRSPGVVLSIREVSDDVRVVALAENHDMAEYLEYAGADRVFSPRRLLGESLANEVTTAVSTELGDTVEIGTDFELVELPVQGGCEIAGTRLADSGIRERTGANVIGLWRRETFDPVPGPDTRLDEGTTLLVAGSEPQLEALKRLTLSEVRRRARGMVVIAGHGEVGSTVRRELASSEMEGVVVDVVGKSDVDVVGDATQEGTLREAGLERASSLILALPDDTMTMLAALVAREVDSEVRVVARAQETESVGKLYRAGADYVLALSTVSGRMLASTLLAEEIVAPETRVEVVRTSAPAFVGESLAGADVRSRTGCTVIAVERDGEVVTELDPDFVIEADDTLIVAGSDGAINRFNAIAQ